MIGMQVRAGGKRKTSANRFARGRSSAGHRAPKSAYQPATARAKAVWSGALKNDVPATKVSAPAA